jgi:hypothetical protein
LVATRDAYYVPGERRGKEIYSWSKESDREVEDPVEEGTNNGSKTLENALATINPSNYEI